MRYGVISDVHANLAALDAVCRRFDAARVDRIICLGDTVGYHAHPNECVARIRERCDVVVAGNHDRAAAGTLDPFDFPLVARRAIAWTRRVADPAHLAYLARLPILAALDAATALVHASLAPEPNDRHYISSPERIAANLDALAHRPERLCWFGHTHRPMVHTSRDGRIWSQRGADAVALDAGARYLINPGSVGQPRDRDPRAACAIFDDGRVEFLRVEFDAAATRRAAEAAGLASPPTALATARAFVRRLLT
ncbi:MAG: metallophosphoesterase family protein [Deltaproteobacteria bacterium]|nr:metallophosphoesterase family protein [Deltaproteobacteria bacterium]